MKESFGPSARSDVHLLRLRRGEGGSGIAAFTPALPPGDGAVGGSVRN
jgi:hypothetical protein